MYKKVQMHVKSCWFANQAYCFFAVVVPVAVAVVVAKAAFSRGSPTTQDSLCVPTHAKPGSQE